MTTQDSVTTLFDSLKTVGDIEELIRQAEPEGKYLECKELNSVSGLSSSFQTELAKEFSGFSNAGGGVIILGVATTPQLGVDILKQLNPIGLVDEVVRKLKVVIPLFAHPEVETRIKILRRRRGDTTGIVVLHIPAVEGDPVMSKRDDVFYLRSGAQTTPMPYETVKRMFLGVTNPDLHVVFDERLIEKSEEGIWKIPIILSNKTAAPGKSVTTSVTFENPSVCEEIRSDNFRDVSEINPGKKIYMVDLDRPTHKELNILIGNFFVKMKPRKRNLQLKIGIYAEQMRAKEQRLKIALLRRGGFKVVAADEKYLY